MTKEKHCIE